MIPGFLFDLDGVLIDSMQFHFESWMHLSKENPLVHISYDDFAKTFGMRNEEILAICYPSGNAEERERARIRKEELFREHCKDKLTLLPGMQAFLEEVKKAGIPRIIASNGPVVNLKFFLEYTALSDYFDRFVSGEEVASGKPSPDVFIEAARRIGYEPSNCIVFEDSPHGLVAGKNAGCFVVALATTNPIQLLNPRDALFTSPLDLNLKAVLELYDKV